MSHTNRLKAAHDLAASSAACVTSVVICKRQFSSPAFGQAYISQPDPMYLWTVRMLLERVSWFIDENGGGSAVVTFAHVRGFTEQKLHDYRSALENTPGVQIRWHVFNGHRFKVESPKQIDGLQWADIAASALGKAIEPDDFGYTEPRYLHGVVPKIYRRKMGKLTSYGLKVFPPAECDTGGSLAWLATL